MENTYTPFNQMSDSGPGSSLLKVSSSRKQQDWCRWPICHSFRQTGSCPLNTECKFAHVKPETSACITQDGNIRVCFESLGLVAPACSRANCKYFHPPQLIRDRIVALKHQEYLKEKLESHRHGDSTQILQNPILSPFPQPSPLPAALQLFNYTETMNNVHFPNPFFGGLGGGIPGLAYPNYQFVPTQLTFPNLTNISTSPTQQLIPYPLSCDPQLAGCLLFPQPPALILPQIQLNEINALTWPNIYQGFWGQPTLPQNDIFPTNVFPTQFAALTPQGVSTACHSSSGVTTSSNIVH